MCPEQSFMVCSTTLARTAPFWDKMLYGEFKEGKKLCLQNNNLKWTVKLPEDNPTAIALLLNIVHSRFDKVPGYKDPLNVRDLYEISVLTDKYNITYTLQPWAKGWLPSVHRSAKRIDESLQAQFRHERLWISWVLGDRTKFEKIAKILLLNSCGSKGNPNSLQYAKVLEPPEIYGEFHALDPFCILYLNTQLPHCRYHRADAFRYNQGTSGPASRYNRRSNYKR